MRALTRALGGGAATASGIAIWCLSTKPFHAHIDGWSAGLLYQLAIGGVMILVGAYTQNISCHGRLRHFSKVLYLWCGTTLKWAGWGVLWNAYWYRFIFVEPGSAPIHFIGIWITLISAFGAAYYLTFDPDASRS